MTVCINGSWLDPIKRQVSINDFGPNSGNAVALPETYGVFYLSIDGVVKQLLAEQANNIPRANGVILSPNESTLYVLLTGRTALMAYPISAPGVIGAGEEIALDSTGDGHSKLSRAPFPGPLVPSRATRTAQPSAGYLVTWTPGKASKMSEKISSALSNKIASKASI